MKFFFSTCGSTKSNDSLESKKIHEELSTSRSYDSSKRLTDAAAKSNSEIRDGISVDDAASKSSSGTREGAPVIGDDVSSNIPSKLFAFVSNRNWAGAARRCSGAGKAQATNWIEKRNNGGSIR